MDVQNDAWSMWLLLLVIGHHTDCCLCATTADFQALTFDLFTSYNKGLRPVGSQNSPLRVDVTLSLASIHDLDEIKQQLTFSGLLDINWVDPSLTWDPGRYSQITRFSYPQDDVWIPDVTVINSVQGVTELGFGRDYVSVGASGRVAWNVAGKFKTNCDIDVTYYPFDTQECYVTLTTLVSKGDEIVLDIPNGTAAFSHRFTESGSWILENFTVTGSESSEAFGLPSGVVFNIKIRRRPLYYVVTILIPVVFLSLTATLVFALPADSGEKMGTSITVLLAFAVYLTIVSDQMPKTSTQVSILAVYLTLLLGQTSMGVLLTVWILNLHFRDDQQPPGRGMRKAVLFFEKLMCKRPAQVGPREEKMNSADLPLEDTSVASRDKVSPVLAPSDNLAMTWRHVSAILDRTLFYSFSILLLFFSIIFLGTLTIGM